MAKDNYLILKQRQALPLDIKICMSKERIRRWYEHAKNKRSIRFDWCALV